MSDKVREEFESWCVKEVELPEGYELNWDNDSVRLMYRGWKASRESLAVNLPLSSSGYMDGCSLELELMDAEEVIEAIHAAGVRTK